MMEKVSDVLDRAQQLEEAERASAALLRKPVLPRTGRCHYCAATLPPAGLFCDADCRDGHAAEQAAKLRNGRR